MILKDLSDVAGKTVELGAGSGNFREFKPDILFAPLRKGLAFRTYVVIEKL
jgi:hypothetical protein